MSLLTARSVNLHALPDDDGWRAWRRAQRARKRRPCTECQRALLRVVSIEGWLGRPLRGRHAFRAPPSQGYYTASGRQGGAAPLLSKNRATRQGRQTPGRGARSAAERQGGRGRMPAPRWGFPHALPHASLVSVGVAPHRPGKGLLLCPDALVL